jgi:hypothetical protein
MRRALSVSQCEHHDVDHGDPVSLVAAGAVEFRVLGGIEVVRAGAARPVAGRKRRTLLAVMLLEAPPR